MFTESWKNAKSNFENATSKKKPSDSFMGVFRKSSGLESATKAMDEAVKKGESKLFSKAESEFQTTWNKYSQMLEKASKDEKSSTYSSEIKKLDEALKKIALDFSTEKTKAADNERQAVVRETIKALDGFINGAQPGLKKAAAAKTQAINMHGGSSDTLAAIAIAASKNDAKAVKDGIGRIAAAGKIVDGLISEFTKALSQLKASRDKINKDYASSGQDLTSSQKDAVSKQKDKAIQVNDQLAFLIDEMRHEREGIASIAEQADAAAKGGMDVTATVLKAIEQLSIRSSKLTGPLDAGTQDASGKLDAQRDRIGGELANETDPERKSVIARNIRMKIDAIKKDVEGQFKQCQEHAQSIKQASVKFPSDIFKSDAAKIFRTAIIDDLQTLDKAEKAFKSAADKAERVLGQLPA